MINSKKNDFLPCQPADEFQVDSLFSFSFAIVMSHLSAATKYHILLTYSSHCSDHSSSALARRHGIKSGRDTVSQWYVRGNDTPASLGIKQRSGSSAVLSRAEDNQHIRVLSLVVRLFNQELRC